MERLKAAVIGIGFIGAAHVEALRRIPYVDVVAIVDGIGIEEKAARLGIPAYFSDYKEMIEKCKPDCVHICTPNHTHMEIALYAFSKGVNVVCEKPMARNAEEAKIMVEAAKKSGLVNAVNFHNRYYPIPYQMRNMVKNGEIGDVFAVQGGYLQDWLQFDTDFSWKILSDKCGKTRATADLGSHWIDLAEYVTGQKVKEVFAEFKTIYPTRKQETSEGVKEVSIDTEDFSYIMLRFDNGAVGSASFSAVFSGKKNQTVLQVAGTKKSLEWDNEKVNDLLIGNRNEANALLTKDPSLADADTASIISYPAGHAEGFPDAFKQNFNAIYNAIRGIQPANPFATFEDGLHMMQICDKIYESAHTGRWVAIN
ncbi:Gfo/Idh/MocA family protein [Jingyaoa shaoxingensis]|uniref:Gfo/Idh/MocA family oxidoreductase n=1 Tax=Jingyaoa shaoxingensis TaxID=2763671 RepID=A0ABR7N967_9FIRM|nr:Gfo/Idh/MocA family oxidoreductase [Jingyaoa shaoxingensis]MBC8572942.1 Gfo/Idh/MocA family oxidoreductase [Jingyaoa shaoxingensis]